MTRLLALVWVIAANNRGNKMIKKIKPLQPGQRVGVMNCVGYGSVVRRIAKNLYEVSHPNFKLPLLLQRNQINPR